MDFNAHIQLIIRHPKPPARKHNPPHHAADTKSFKILEADSLGFVQEYWDESFLRMNTEKNDWMLELNTEPDGNKLEKILALKNVEEYNA